MIQIEYKGCLWRSDDFNYSPEDMGSYYNPPEPSELEINTLEVADSWRSTKSIFYNCPDPILTMMQEDDEFMKKFEQAIIDAAREYEPRDSCEMAGEDSCG